MKELPSAIVGAMARRPLTVFAIIVALGVVLALLLRPINITVHL